MLFQSSFPGFIAVLATFFACGASALNRTTAPTINPALFTATINIGAPLKPIPIPGGMRLSKILPPVALHSPLVASTGPASCHTLRFHETD